MTILAACTTLPSELDSAHAPDLVPDSQGLHWRGVLAAVDLGSNSFRLELAQIREGRYQRIAYLKEMVRLGGGLDARGRLTPLASQRGLACLARFRQRLGGLPAMQLRAVATQTLREAGNTGANIDAAKAVGKLVAERAVKQGVKEVVFDRGGYLYHGRVKALADAAREGGLSF